MVPNKIKNKLVLVILIIVCLSLFDLNAQESRSFNKSIDIGVSNIFCGIQSTKDYIFWFGTENGIISFNGKKINTFKSKNIFFGISALSLIENSEGNILMILENGNLGLYSNNTFLYKNVGKKIYNLKNYKFLKIDNSIYFHNHQNLSSKLFKIYKIKNNLEFEEVDKRILKFKNDEVLIFNKHVKFSKYEIFDLKGNLIFKDGSIIYDLMPYKSEVFIGTSKGLISLDIKSKSKTILIRNQKIISCFIDNNNNLVAVSNNGVLFISSEIDLKIEYSNDEKVINNFKINDNNCYVIDENSLNILNFKNRELFRQDIGSIYNNYQDFFINEDKSINYNKYIINGTTVYNANYNPFKKITINKKNYLLTTGYSDLKLVNLESNQIKTIYYDSFNTKYGFYNKIKNCVQLNNSFYLATKSGLIHLNFDSMSFSCKINHIYLENKQISYLEQHQNKIWFISSPNNLNVIYNNLKFDNIFKKNDLNNKIINCFKCINDSILAVGTNEGLFILKYKINKEFVVNVLYKIDFYNGKNIGNIVSIQKNSNLLCFANKSSIYSIKLENIKTFLKKSQEKIFIDYFEFNNVKYYNIVNKLNLEPQIGKLNIRIDHSSIKDNYENPFINYCLLKDNDTVLFGVTNNYLLSFNSLTSGDYKVVANIVNGLSENSKIINFNIKPRFKETILFKIIFFVLILLIAVLFVYYYNSIKIKKIKLKNLIIENENINLKILKSQLNPHFIFNSLNSLKGIIYFNQNSKAMDYIDKLSYFFRNILTINENVVGKLCDEIEIIENYISLENFRINDKVKLVNQINQKYLEIVLPSNILQVIIENSILHGFTQGETLIINIDCRENKDYYELQIQNNGLKIELVNNKTISFGMASIEKRLNQFNNLKFNKNIEINNIFENEIYVGVLCKMKIRK